MRHFSYTLGINKFWWTWGDIEVLNFRSTEMHVKDSSKIESMKVPEFLNTPEKWKSVVEDIDTAKKFDDVALKILDDDDIDVFEF